MIEVLRRVLPQRESELRTFEVIAGSVTVLLISGLVLALPAKAVLAGVVAIIAGLYFFARPEIGLLAVFAARVLVDLLWWVPGSFGGLNLLEAFGGGVAAMAAVLFYLELRRVERQPGFIPLMLYLGVMFVAVARSGQVRDAAEILAKYVSPLLLMFLVSSLMSSHQRRMQLLGLITGAGLVSLALSVYHLAAGQRFHFLRQGYFRLHGGYANLHNHALFLLFLNTLLFFWFMTRQRRVERLGAVLALGAGLICLYYTFVRTAMTGFAVFVGLYLLMEKRYRLLAVAGVAGLALLATNDSLQDRFRDVVLVFSDSDDASKRTLGSGRWGIWTTSIREYLGRGPIDILLGLGLGGHYEVTDAYANMYRSTNKSENLDSHNDYLTLLYQLGPIAVVCYLALQVLVVTHGLRLRRLAVSAFDRSYGSYVVALCAVVAVTNALSNSFIQRITPAWLFWAAVGVLFAMHKELPVSRPKVDLPVQRRRAPPAPRSDTP